MTKEVHQMHHNAHRAERLWKRKPTSINWAMFKWAQKDYKYTLRKAKRQCVCEEITRVGQNPRMLYNKVKYLTSTQKDNPLPPHSNDKELA